MNTKHFHVLGFLLATCLFASVHAKPVHHYVFFGQDRDQLRTAKSFLETNKLEGAQIVYTWRQLEPQKDQYDFSMIREDLAFLKSHGKRLWIQFQDVTFSASRINVPKYLLEDPKYNGGADKQYEVTNGDEERAVEAGWMARRWDPAVQERLHKLLTALGKEFDGKIEGINFAETSSGVGRSGRLFPKGFTFQVYRDGIITNMKALRTAFPKSIVLQYANFMPGEWLPAKDGGHLRAVYRAARELKVGVGGPDLLPSRRGQLNHAYPLIRESAGIVPAGIAVQDGNYAEVNREMGRRPSIHELINFATDYLKVDYIFWCTEEPYYSAELIPFMRA